MSDRNPLPAIVEKILEQRGIVGAAVEPFLHPDFSRDTHNGSSMKGMKEAVERIHEALIAGETIGVFGDYDADGVPATAVLVRGFDRLEVAVVPLIPTRASGYGLTMEVVDTVVKGGITLLITVDNGTVAKAEIAELKKRGVDTIVCDHHEPQAEHIATAAVAILNPKQADCSYPFSELCGCAIAWKLMGEVYKNEGLDPLITRWDLDLVALSTIADMVPLLGENRVLVIFGMQVLRKSRNRGLQALAEVAGIALTTISPGSVAFQLAPRINAPSRMHQEIDAGVHVSLQLLTTDDPKEAKRLAEFLDAQNRERQGLVDMHLAEAEPLLVDIQNDLCIVLYSESWSTGVIGLVAGKMLERYKRPVIALAPEGGVIKGSVRSVDGVNAVELLQAASATLEKYGGHSKAAGLTMLPNATANDLRQAILEWFKGTDWSLTSLAAAAQRLPDASLPLKEVSIETAEALKTLEPFGIGFPKPLFHTKCTLQDIRLVGANGKHLACILVENGETKKGIGFGWGHYPVKAGTEYDIRYYLDIEEWNNRITPICHIQYIYG